MFCVFFERASEAYNARKVECSMCVWEYTWWFDTVPEDPRFTADQIDGYARIREHARGHKLLARLLIDVVAP